MTKKCKKGNESEKDRKQQRKLLVNYCKRLLDASHKYSEHFKADDLILAVNALLFFNLLSFEEIEDICRSEHRKYFDLSDLLK